MCVMCLAAQRPQSDYCDSHESFETLGLSDTYKAGQAPSVNDERSILYYLDGGDNFRWNAESDLGSSVVVTYSFSEGRELPSTSGFSSNPYNASYFSDFTEAQRSNFRLAAAEFMSVSGIVLIEVDSGADIDVYNAHGTNVGGYADLPYVSGSYQGDVDLVVDSYGDYDVGSYGYFTILHELGHALGLDHTHEGAYTLNSGSDSTNNSVMSYNYVNGTSTLKHLDVAALQHLYGSTAMSSGWSVSRYLANVKVKLDGTDQADVFVASKTVNNLGLSNKVFGQDGDDYIVGLDLNDILRGNRGDDYLSGLAGDDKLRGGGGSDSIYGGEGEDFIHGGSGRDTIFGQGGDDILWGGAANDEVYGGTGDDILLGHRNKDTLDGGEGADTLEGGRGEDVLTGGSGVDTFVFRVDSSHDQITDFDEATEQLTFVDTGFGFADVSISTVDGHAQITVGSVVIDLLGVSASVIGADDFNFV